MKRLIALGIFGGFLFFSLTLLAQVPQLLNYQGRLTDDAGTPITTATTLRFSLYQGGDAATPGSGTLCYQEDASVTPDGNGVFSHLIGSGTVISGALDSTVFQTADPVYLEITIDPAGANETLLPRKQIVTVGYSFKAELADDADTVDGQDASAFAPVVHNHDPDYVNEGQADSVNSSMIVNGTIVDADISAGANIAGSKIDPTGLDADLLDGKDSEDFVHTAGDDMTGTLNVTTATGYALFATTSDFNGRGVYGIASTYVGTNYGVYGESASNTGYGVYGEATNTDGANYGVYGKSNSTTGGKGVYGAAPHYGLFGEATATSGANYGVYGTTPSTSDFASGVFGYASGTSGKTRGVYGRSDSSSGGGVYGYASANTGTTYGVYGQSDSTTGRGVYGIATDTSGYTWGVYGESMSTSGRGVYGQATASEGTTYGVYGRSDSIDGKGVYGYAYATSGYADGVYGTSNSPNGSGVCGAAPAYGVYGKGTAAEGITYGVYGTSNNTSGRGVYGEVLATTGENYGVYGLTNSTGGRGVYGLASATSGYADGVHGISNSSQGSGVYGEASATTGTNYGVIGKSNSTTGGKGVYGEASATTGTNYGVFGVTSSIDGYGGYFVGRVHVTGNLTVDGDKSSVQPIDNGKKVLLYAMESPEIWFEDFGTAKLVNGQAVVQLENVFTQAANTEAGYMVFLTPIGEWKGLYISRQDKDSFEVREQGDGTSNVSFFYRIVAKRRGYEEVRFEEFTEPEQPPAEPNLPIEEK